MKITLPRLLSVALPLGAFSSLALATQSDEKLVPAYPPASGRTTAAATAAPSSGSTQPLIATCLPAIKDQAGAGCIQASSIPTLGDLYPMSPSLNVDAGSGNVGVGTTFPFHSLTVNGSAMFGPAENIGVAIDANSQARLGLVKKSGMGPTIVSANLDAITFNHTDQNDVLSNIGGAVFRESMRINPDGNVGIGTFSPTAKLHVNGSARVTGQTTLATTEIVSSNDLRFGAPGENTDDIYFQRYAFTGDQSVLELVLGDNPAGGAGNDAFTIVTRDSAGGSLTTRYQFNSDGTAQKPGGGSWTALSDRRAKHDIQPLVGALDKVLALAGKTFEYNDPTAPGAIEGECIGFIAQDVEQIFPEWVNEQADGTKTLTIRGFEALTVESLRELKTENDELREKNAELEGRVERLESVQSEIASLKAALATLVENR